MTGATALAVGVLASPMLGTLAPSFAQSVVPAPTDGVLVAANDTLPRGAAWLDGSLGGHLWVSDAVTGICRLDPQNAAGQPPFLATNCQGAAKSGGQIVVGDTPTTPTDKSKYVYVADDSTTSTSVVRFKFTPGNETLSAPLAMDVPNQTSVGGGARGGRAVALALAPSASGTDDDLYVGYLKSGDVVKVSNVRTNASATPPTAWIGETSDGRGVNSFVMLGPDLYLAELGGFGVSVINDPGGLNPGATPCPAIPAGGAPGGGCTAASLSPQPSFFPGGMATDGTFIYIGDAPRAAPNSILQYAPASGAVATYSNVVPVYKSTFDGQTRTQYVAPLGLGLRPNGDLYIGDDATAGLPAPGAPAGAAPPPNQGHIWKVPAKPTPPVVTKLSTTPITNPVSGPDTGGTKVTITGSNLAAVDPTGKLVAGSTSVLFGTAAATGVTCASVSLCTATSPAMPGGGAVDVRVTVTGQPQSAIVPADQFTYLTPTATAKSPTVGSLSPNKGLAAGGTHVTITGTNLWAGDPTKLPSITFGTAVASGVSCASVTSCTAVSPAGTSTVDVHVAFGGATSASVAGDKFTYSTPTASLYAWGITAPKGGAVWLPSSTSTPTSPAGHWWSSDHAQGLCRQDAVPGSSALHAINFSVCGDDAVGSAGQAVYDPRPIPGSTNPSLHYVYVPDNAVKSTAVWRLTFDQVSETMVADPQGGAMATAMLPLADVRTLKPNGMALGPDGNLYVTDLVEANVRQVTNPNGDPRLQTINIVAQTGDGRGANGTQGFISNLLYISENRGTSFFDVTQCPTAAGPCATVKVPLDVPAAGVFVAGTAVDAAHKLVYISDSPGGANATVYRYDASHDTYNAANPAASTVGAPAPIFVTGGTLPATGVATDCAVPSPITPGSSVNTTGCERPWDAANHPTTTAGFAFAFGMATDSVGNLVITEDPTAGNRSGRGTMWIVPYLP